MSVNKRQGAEARADDTASAPFSAPVISQILRTERSFNRKIVTVGNHPDSPFFSQTQPDLRTDLITAAHRYTL